MNSDSGQLPPEPVPGTDVAPLWSAPMPGGGGLLTLLPSGGCIASTSASLLAYRPDGRLRWEAAAVARVFGGEPAVTPDGALVRIEDGSVITRALLTGEVLGSFAAPLGSGIGLAPWGDLIYSQAAPGGTAAVRCVTRTGVDRWSVSLDGPAALTIRPLVLGDVVVVNRRGALWALDQAGRSPWLADNHGVRAPEPEDNHRRAATDPNGGVELHAAPARLDAGRALVALEWFAGDGLYLLDGVTPRLTPVTAPGAAPYAVLPHAPTEYRIAGLGPQIEVRRMDWRYPIVSFEPDGRRLWEHPLPAKAIALAPAPGGNLIAAASPTATRWRDYQQWYDLSGETFVRCIGPDGTARWTWHAPGPLTHLPVVGPDGVVYVGCDQRLWAFATGA
jgi:hypothetical protein